MDFTLNDTQTALQDMLRRLLTNAGTGIAELGESGVFAALVPEAFGGIAGTGVEAMIVAEEFGRAGRENPFVETGILASLAIDRLGNDAQRSAWLPRIATGDAIIAYAGPEHGVTYTREGDVALLSGSAPIVPYGGGCDLFIVAAKGPGDSEPHLFLLDPDARGLERTRFQSIDGARSASLRLDSARAEPLGEPDAAALDEIVDRALVAQSAERVGLMAGLLNATLEQLRTRKQFGTVLGDFQALQHRLADMFIAYEMARSTVIKAALVEADGVQRPRAAAAAKYLSARSARSIGYEAVQMHGAMGMTEEMGLGRYVRRIAALDARFGTPAQQLRRLAQSAATAIH